MRATNGMMTWEAACIVAGALIVASVTIMVLVDEHRLLERRAAYVERMAAEFEDPACAQFVQRPVTELPRHLDWREYPCTAVLQIRRDAYLRGESTQISAADVRGWVGPERPEFGRALIDAAVHGGPLFALLYGCGFATSVVVRRVPSAGAAFRKVADVMPPGVARRATAFLLYLFLFLALAGAGAYAMLLAQPDLGQYYSRHWLSLRYWLSLTM